MKIHDFLRELANQAEQLILEAYVDRGVYDDPTNKYGDNVFVYPEIEGKSYEIVFVPGIRTPANPIPGYGLLNDRGRIVDEYYNIEEYLNTFCMDSIKIFNKREEIWNTDAYE